MTVADILVFSPGVIALGLIFGPVIYRLGTWVHFQRQRYYQMRLRRAR